MPANKVTTMIPWPNPPESKSQLMHDQQAQGEAMRAMMRKPDDWSIVVHRYGGVKLVHIPTEGLLTIYFLTAEKRYQCLVSLSHPGTGDCRWKDAIFHQHPQDAVDHTLRIASDLMRRESDSMGEILATL